jgi:D-3-phosphoglycerate dehydrogenase
VNFVNAPFIAKELGLSVGESREAGGGNYPNLLRVRYETEKEVRECAGTVFGTSSVRLVMIDGFRFEVNPEGHLLIYYNIDRPGMLAQVGAILAAHNVNIAGLSLGRTAIGEKALTVVNVDSDIPGEVLEKIRTVGGVTDVRVVTMA